MKIMSFILSVFLLFNITAVLAHSDHAHAPITSGKAIAIAGAVVENLASQDVGLGFGQLAKSWVGIADNHISVHSKKKDYYVVSVVNPKEKRTLYVLMSVAGEVYDANFTGVFKGVND